MTAADTALVVREFDESVWPAGNTRLEDAWLAIYQVLMWHDDGLPHIFEVSHLRTPSGRRLAETAQAFLADALGVPPGAVEQYLDRMWRLPRWQGMQRNNPVGHGFRILTAEVLRRWGHPELDYMEEEPALNWFPGIQMPGRSASPRIDVFVTKDDRPRAILSCKWGIRHDRISDPTNECQEYRAAIARRQIKPFEYYVVTSEFSAARLEKILDQPCVDGLVHTHLPLLRQLVEPSRRLWTYANLYDLVDFVDLTATW